MKYQIIIFLGLFILLNSCHDSLSLKEEKIYSNENVIIQQFYLNSLSQKDSIEYFFGIKGVLLKKIYWNNGVIDSVISFNKQEEVSNVEILKDSLLYEYDRNRNIISKSSVDNNGNYIGTKIIYSDSLVTGLLNYHNGEKEGLFLSFDKNESPISIHYLSKNYPIFSLSFFENGTVKSIRSYNKAGHLGINFKYHENGKLKSKSELYDGKTDGVIYEYDNEGNQISKRKYLKGKLDNS